MIGFWKIAALLSGLCLMGGLYFFASKYSAGNSKRKAISMAFVALSATVVIECLLGMLLQGYRWFMSQPFYTGLVAFGALISVICIYFMYKSDDVPNRVYQILARIETASFFMLSFGLEICCARQFRCSVLSGIIFLFILVGILAARLVLLYVLFRDFKKGGAFFDKAEAGDV